MNTENAQNATTEMSTLQKALNFLQEENMQEVNEILKDLKESDVKDEADAEILQKIYSKLETKSTLKDVRDLAAALQSPKKEEGMSFSKSEGNSLNFNSVSNNQNSQSTILDSFREAYTSTDRVVPMQSSTFTKSATQCGKITTYNDNDSSFFNKSLLERRLKGGIAIHSQDVSCIEQAGEIFANKLRASLDAYKDGKPSYMHDAELKKSEKAYTLYDRGFFKPGVLMKPITQTFEEVVYGRVQDPTYAFCRIIPVATDQYTFFTKQGYHTQITPQILSRNSGANVIVTANASNSYKKQTINKPQDFYVVTSIIPADLGEYVDILGAEMMKDMQVQLATAMSEGVMNGIAGYSGFKGLKTYATYDVTGLTLTNRRQAYKEDTIKVVQQNGASITFEDLLSLSESSFLKHRAGDGAIHLHPDTIFYLTTLKDTSGRYLLGSENYIRNAETTTMLPNVAIRETFGTLESRGEYRVSPPSYERYYFNGVPIVANPGVDPVDKYTGIGTGYLALAGDLSQAYAIITDQNLVVTMQGELAKKTDTGQVIINDTIGQFTGVDRLISTGIAASGKLFNSQVLTFLVN